MRERVVHVLWTEDLRAVCVEEPRTWQAYMRLMRDALRAMPPVRVAPAPSTVTVTWDPQFYQLADVAGGARKAASCPPA